MLTDRDLADYRRDGFVLVPGPFAPAAIDAARAALEQLFYGMPFAQWLATRAAAAAPDSIPDGVAPLADGRRTRWPTGHEALDRLIENDALIAGARHLLGSEPLFGQGVLFVRAGPTDRRFPAAPHAGWHFDHFNNGLLPPAPGPGGHDYLNVAVFLTDVDDDCAPTLMLPGTHARAAALASAQLERGNFVDGAVGDLRLLGPLPRPVPAIGRAGTVWFYSSYLLHSAQPFVDRSRQRAFWTLSLGRREQAPWCRHTNPFDYTHREFTRAALARTTANVRTLLGWPPPGDAYYRAETLRLLEQLYPGIDVSAYRAACPADGDLGRAT